MQLECVMTWTASSKRVHYHSKRWLAHKCRPGVLAIVVLNIATWVTRMSPFSPVTAFSDCSPPLPPPPPSLYPLGCLLNFAFMTPQGSDLAQLCSEKQEKKKEKKKQTLAKLDDGLHPLWAKFDMRTNWRFPKRAQRIDATQQEKKTHENENPTAFLVLFSREPRSAFDFTQVQIKLATAKWLCLFLAITFLGGWKTVDF